MSVALVTGAGRGVGRGCALALADAGFDVVVASRTADNGEPVAEEVRARGARAICVPTDVLSRDAIFAAVARAVEEFGGLDVMVHNAFTGTGRPYRIEDSTPEEWQRSSRSAVWASIWCAQAASPYLKASDNGRLILVSSAAGMEGSVSLPLYAAVKGGQRGLATSLAREWGGDGVTVNCIAPLAVTDALEGAFVKNPSLRGQLEARVALKRLGDPENDIGSVVAFLASPGGGYITGQTILCDGGNFIAATTS